ncbi:DUF3088 family protein [Brevundimonas sp. Root1279]|uniref:DUF3088 family protein n=1 Tax=Brevundimonas sp. Root1279 TaxID=1736443 RepID=UPI0006FA4F48|nr:DUF3088 family protein [Brevundimonas sp. Root1279]KQW83852.1 hypothetical protein ASC65_04225 [Brevundimonas sp. Root1279]
MTDRLFLLNPDWFDAEGGPWYCPAGAVVEGVLAFYPALRDQLAITYLDHPRPRPPVIELVGEDHQSCPILILDGDFDWPEAQTSEATGARFLQDGAIIPYLAARYGIGLPHP